MKDIVFEHVKKSYGKTSVVKDLNLEIREGERLILLGPSGCGKSTTLRMIAGLEDITDGRLYMGGRVVNEVSCGDRNVGMVFQNYALFPHMTVEENIIYGLKVNKVEKGEIEKRLQAALEMLGLADYRKRKPKELSGGQRQRVALARAVVKRADYFLLDEPLSNLDAQLRLHARKELVKIHEEFGQTFVYVTHDQVEAMTVGHRIALLEKGELQMIDTPENVYNHPVNVFTAKFIGSPATNIVEAHTGEGRLIIASQRVEMEDGWKRQAAKSGTDHFYFGIRPEHIRLIRQKEENTFEAVVKYVEDYGNKLGVYLDIEGAELIALCESEAPGPGDRVYFRPDGQRMHLFDYKTTMTIGYPGEKKAYFEEACI